VGPQAKPGDHVKTSPRPPWLSHPRSHIQPSPFVKLPTAGFLAVVGMQWLPVSEGDSLSLWSAVKNRSLRMKESGFSPLEV